MTRPSTMAELEQRFDDGEDVLDYAALSEPAVEVAPACDNTLRQVSVSLPAWLVDVMDDEARRRGVSRKAVINGWLVDRADAEARRRADIA